MTRRENPDSLRPRRSTHQLDTEALYVRLDKVRRDRRMSWRDVGRETRVHPTTFGRLGRGHQIASEALITLMLWAGITDITPLAQPRPEETTPR